MKLTRLLPLFLSLYFVVPIWGQYNLDRFQQLEQDLAEYADDYKNIDKAIDISITGTIQEFAIAFSKETKLNLTIAPEVNQKVVTNFSNTRPRDILLHLCKFYQLDLTFSGSIISLIPYKLSKEVKPILVKFNAYNNKLELDLKKDTLDQVVKKISELSKKNVISTQRASNQLVSGYVGGTNFESAIKQMAKRNNLSLTKNDLDYFILDLDSPEINTKGQENSSTRSRSNNRNNRRSVQGSNQRNKLNSLEEGSLEISSSMDSFGVSILSINAISAPLAEVIRQASDETKQNFFLFSEPDEKLSLKLENVPYNTFLEQALKGTTLSFKEEGGLFLIGNSDSDGLKESKVIQLQHRSVKDLSQSLPKGAVEGLDVQEFAQLNSFIVSGPSGKIDQLDQFLQDIDKPVPVVMIELLILDVQKNNETRIGFEMGLADEPVKPGGRIFPEANFTFSSRAINKLLGTLAGNGVVNLGKVSPNFYATLQAVEDNGYVKVRSKPRLSTLNSVEASLSLGETRYYLNERTTLQGNQNPVSLQDRRFESVNADFSIRIVPIVSGDEYVTLEIEFNQSSFIGQLQNNAPPPQVNRTFNSNIRMSNQEMIVLGGLEDKRTEDSGTGVPLLSRIPIIKWLFSKKRKAKSSSKLLIFVKPTVIY